MYSQSRVLTHFHWSFIAVLTWNTAVFGMCVYQRCPQTLVDISRNIGIVTFWGKWPPGNYINGLVQDCSISISNTLELLQSCTKPSGSKSSLQWCHKGYDCISNHQPYDRLLNRLFRRRSKKTSKLHVTGFCAGNSPETGESPAQMASNTENVSIWWRHHHIIRPTG